MERSKLACFHILRILQELLLTQPRLSPGSDFIIGLTKSLTPYSCLHRPCGLSLGSWPDFRAPVEQEQQAVTSVRPEGTETGLSRPAFELPNLSPLLGASILSSLPVKSELGIQGEFWRQNIPSSCPNTTQLAEGGAARGGVRSPEVVLFSWK